MLTIFKTFFALFKKKPIIPSEPSEYYYHTKKRVQSLYGCDLSYDQFLEWNRLIQMLSTEAFFVMNLVCNTKMYIVKLDKKNISVVYSGNTIITAVPYNTEMIRKALLRLTGKFVV